MSGAPKLSLENLSKSFGPKLVLDGISLAVDAGESLVVIGGSGTGKSVMLKCILGLLHADGGKVYFDGTDITNLGGRTRERLMTRFGMLFQGGALFDSLTVWENVAFGLRRSQQIAKSKARDAAIDTLARVGLGADVAALRPAELSGGMQKRVALARAIATAPEVIFFDEPTTGLDPIMADIINELIRSSVKTLGATALTITHDIASARKIADKVAMIHKGRVIWTGPVSELDHSGNPYVEQFIHGRAEGPIKMDIRRR